MVYYECHYADDRINNHLLNVWDMMETMRITVNEVASIVFTSTIGGFLISTLVLKYYFAKRRARKLSPAQAELARLADYIATNHPEYVSESFVTDSAIKLIDVLYKQKSPL